MRGVKGKIRGSKRAIGRDELTVVLGKSVYWTTSALI